MAAFETRTLLFTDLVGSTEAHIALGAASDDVRRSYFELLRGALLATGGDEVKNLGDGLMAAYGGAAAGVSGAVEMQRAITRYNRRAARPFAVRIGLSTGDVTPDEGDYFGTAVIEAARLSAAAGGGQIMVSETTRLLCSGEAELEFEPAGELDLKGFGRPLAAWSVTWDTGAAESAPLPRALARSAAEGWFVGRERELAVLDGEWKRAAGGERRCMLLGGEPGVGKTRVAAAFAERVRGEGGLVLLGRCDGEVNAPFAPFVEALRELVASAESDLLGAHVRAHGGELGRLVPQLGDRVPVLRPPREADPDTELMRLHEAAIGLLDAAATRQPLLLVLDDVHWADRPSLVLLRRLLRTPDEAPILVLATFRDVPSDKGEALRAMLADLVREPRVRRMDLAGLDEPEIAALLEAAVGHEVGVRGQQLAGELHRETDGNPLFTTELLRHLVEEGAIQERDGRFELQVDVSQLGLPGTVREVVSQRVERLGEEAQRVLRAASVIGRHFELGLLAGTANLSEDAVLDVLERASDAAVVVESTSAPGRFSFAHALIQRALADEIGPTRRGVIHRRVAERLQLVAASQPGRLGEVAHHWIAAGDAARAIDAAVGAGRHALDVLAPGEAARWFAEALEMQGEDDEPMRAELLIQLGDAERLAGNDDYGRHLLDAGRLALRLGDPDRLVRAALANNRGMQTQTGLIDDERVEMLKAALGAVDIDHPARPQLLATLASELWSDARDRRVGLSDQAVAEARSLGDDRVLADVIYRRCLTVAEPSTVEQRLELTEELLELAERLGDPLTGLQASAERGRVALEAGDGDEARRHAARQRELAASCGAAYGRHLAGWATPWPLMLDGRFDDAEQAANAALQESMSTGQADAVQIYGSLVVALRWEQGRLGEIVDQLAIAAREPDALPAFSALAAHALAECGRGDDAAGWIAAAATDAFELPLDAIWLTGTALWGEAVARTGDAESAALLLERLLPWRAQVTFTGITSYGAVARVAGLLAARLGRDVQADELFEEAEIVHERLRAPSLVSRTRIDWGEALARRGERARARTLLRDGREQAVRLGCTALVVRADELIESRFARGSMGGVRSG